MGSVLLSHRYLVRMFSPGDNFNAHGQTTMRAARYHGQKDVRVEDVPVPKPGPDQCLVEIEWGGICGSDLHEYLAGKCKKKGTPPTSTTSQMSRPGG